MDEWMNEQNHRNALLEIPDAYYLLCNKETENILSAVHDYLHRRRSIYENNNGKAFCLHLE